MGDFMAMYQPGAIPGRTPKMAPQRPMLFVPAGERCAPVIPDELLTELGQGITFRTWLSVFALVSGVGVLGYAVPAFVAGTLRLGTLVIALFFATLVASISVAVTAAYRRARAKESLLDLFKPSVDSCRSMKESLTSFLQDIDTRTRSYFHCVSSVKIAQYFKLREIEQELDALVRELEADLESGTLDSFHDACHRLETPISFRDRLLQEGGYLNRVPLAFLPQFIERLVRDLKSGLEHLEEDIRVQREKCV